MTIRIIIVLNLPLAKEYYKFIFNYFDIYSKLASYNRRIKVHRSPPKYQNNQLIPKMRSKRLTIKTILRVLILNMRLRTSKIKRRLKASIIKMRLRTSTRTRIRLSVRVRMGLLRNPATVRPRMARSRPANQAAMLSRKTRISSSSRRSSSTARRTRSAGSWSPRRWGRARRCVSGASSRFARTLNRPSSEA